MTEMQERAIAANAIAQKVRINVSAKDVRFVSKIPNIYAMQQGRTTILCNIAYDGSTTIETVEW